MLYYEDIDLGARYTSREYYVDKDELIDFAKQWDPQPFHIDEEAARGYPTGLIGTSVHSYAILTKLLTESDQEPPAMVAGLGIEDWRMPYPLRPGDAVHAVGSVESKRESKSKPEFGILVSRSELINQDGKVVLTHCSSGLIMKRPQSVVA
ncbi:MaoC/PaaZ C-terminal domain-containing protein [Litorivivens sp.]|uniref:MaoC/PaaZ C-terminal domain-containing protein n=1 Tax=Litorivivens sp. TaxID=2020868 RepID=UPI003561CACC